MIAVLVNYLYVLRTVKVVLKYEYIYRDIG